MVGFPPVSISYHMDKQVHSGGGGAGNNGPYLCWERRVICVHAGLYEGVGDLEGRGHGKQICW